MSDWMQLWVINSDHTLISQETYTFWTPQSSHLVPSLAMFFTISKIDCSYSICSKLLNMLKISENEIYDLVRRISYTEQLYCKCHYLIGYHAIHWIISPYIFNFFPNERKLSSVAMYYKVSLLCHKLVTLLHNYDSQWHQTWTNMRSPNVIIDMPFIPLHYCSINLLYWAVRSFASK